MFIKMRIFITNYVFVHSNENKIASYGVSFAKNILWAAVTSSCYMSILIDVESKNIGAMHKSTTYYMSYA